MDRHLSMPNHVNNTFQKAYLGLRSIGKIRKYLSSSSTERLVHAFITSKLDYCNSLMYGLPVTELQKLQRIQNAFRLVARVKRSEHIKPTLRKLYWLPVSQRICFKVLLFTYKALNSCAPSYITELITPYVPKRSLRSAGP
jgi:hypothetical protein